MADANTEIIKALGRIEDVLKKASHMYNGPKQRTGAEVRRENDEKKKEKVFKASLNLQSELNKSAGRLTQSFANLRKQVSSSTAGLGKLDHAVNRLIKTINTVQPNLNQQSVTNAPTVSNAAPSRPVVTAQPPHLPPQHQTPPAASTVPLQPLTTGRAPWWQTITNFNTTLFNGTGVMKKTFLRFEQTIEATLKVIKAVTADYFELARIGAGSISSVGEIYMDAFKNGMSFKEYLGVINNSMSLVARSSSFADFDKTISQSTATLNHLGVFGEEATNFQASVGNAMAQIGISADKIPDAVNQQVNAFAKLNKQTLISAQEFSRLADRIAENESVQAMLNGLAPQERQAKFNDLMQLQMHNRALNINTAAADKLTDAMIAQKGASFKDRFEGMQQLRQIGAMMGLQNEAERAAQLYVQGAGQRGAAGDIELQNLLGVFTQAADRMNQSSAIPSQLMHDIIGEITGSSGLGAIMRATVPATLAQPIDPKKVNDDFGKHVGTFGTIVGNMMTWYSGFEKSVIGGQTGLLASIVALIVGPTVIKSVLSGAAGLITNAGAMIGNLFTGSYMAAVSNALMGGLKVSLVGSFISAISEFFTGDLASLLGGDKILGIGSAIIRGLYTWITKPIDYFFGTTFTNSIDKALTWAEIKMVKLGSWFDNLLGFGNKKDNETKLKALEKTYQELQKDSASTLGALGERHRLTQEELAEQTAKSNKKMTESTTKALATVANNTASTFNSVASQSDITRASLVANARTMVEVPPMPQKTVGPTTPPAPPTETASTKTTETTVPAPVNTPQSNDMLSAIVEVLQNIYAVNQDQLNAIRLNRSVAFKDTDATFNKILGT